MLRNQTLYDAVIILTTNGIEFFREQLRQNENPSNTIIIPAALNTYLARYPLNTSIIRIKIDGALSRETLSNYLCSLLIIPPEPNQETTKLYYLLFVAQKTNRILVITDPAFAEEDQNTAETVFRFLDSKYPKVDILCSQPMDLINTPSLSVSPPQNALQPVRSNTTEPRSTSTTVYALAGLAVVGVFAHAFANIHPEGARRIGELAAEYTAKGLISAANSLEKFYRK